ncbi:MAG: PHP domain-containing protein [Deltaproteobacteria bacterium]|nr:PHP domain-containing protein [Deltaproteobacteria bacterium]
MARGVSEGQRRQGAIYERRIASMTYAELHCRTNFSFLSGASHPHELVAQAGALGLTALAITDLSGVYGVVRAWEARRKILAAHERGERDAVNGALIARPPRLIYGSELQLDPIPRDGGRRDPIATRHGDRRDPSGLRGADRREPSDALVVLARDGAGWSKLTALITRGRRRVAKGAFSLTQAEVRHAGGAHWVVLAGGPRSRLLRLLRRGEIAAVRRELFALREAFGDALFVEVTRHRRPGDGARSRAIAALAREINVPVVATNDVFFHAVERKRLQDILECLRLGVSLSEAGRRLWPNAERRL